ncbi:MAG: hypothetical protein DMG39_23870 [Acidobacteria bacterium]|nr:MAG: hypothetical protein DMG39_23870 [Acidobacteriota bacterium]
MLLSSWSFATLSPRLPHFDVRLTAIFSVPDPSCMKATRSLLASKSSVVARRASTKRCRTRVNH